MKGAEKRGATGGRVYDARLTRACSLQIHNSLVELHVISQYYRGMYSRVIDLSETLTHKSIFLFGPRQTGKTTLVRQSFPEAAFYDLLEAGLSES